MIQSKKIIFICSLSLLFGTQIVAAKKRSKSIFLTQKVKITQENKKPYADYAEWDVSGIMFNFEAGKYEEDFNARVNPVIGILKTNFRPKTEMLKKWLKSKNLQSQKHKKLLPEKLLNDLLTSLKN